ncbi:MAG: 2-C-methyl-D-erythritol 4-phosphate cytidylyltransferase [Lactobacillales bacterium]|jgi:2-C-methyl-D-erythritol 4-phosphate cytidylyltransferase|nr:2-C-methyl-D-erythritol 4-phosphate cytidylyltransferase [Lactobacillales bacterium]
MNYEVILLAAGLGKRMKVGKNKVLLEIGGKPVLQYSIDLFLADKECVQLILVVKEEEKATIQKFLPKTDKKITLVTGGSERQYSVANGVASMLNAENIVLVHDGARPFLTSEGIQALQSALKESQVALLGVPVKDTIKKVRQGVVTATVPREILWQAQTPQAFHGETLKEVHTLAQAQGFLGTDDVSLVEEFLPEIPIQMVMGSYENIKLTTPEDLYLGEAIIARSREKEWKTSDNSSRTRV